MTSVYMVIAVWMPATVVPTSLATVAIDTFITELSSVMRNCADANVSRIVPDAAAARSVVTVTMPLPHRPAVRLGARSWPRWWIRSRRGAVAEGNNAGAGRL